ncbi:MAG TPA: hypothetical protein VLK53_13495 [Gaiellaceae bacterium]|nr:hypothetical protein [Gaiellaceae bacterium]
MSRLTWKLVGSTAAIVAAALMVTSASALNKPGAVTISAATKAHTHLDAGARGRSTGDVDIYRLVLYNKRIQVRPLGHGEMVCTTVAGSTQHCDATYFLPRGELVVSGVISSRLIYVVAVVGGTDLYNNVRGTLTVTSLRRTPARDLLVFRLTV